MKEKFKWQKPLFRSYYCLGCKQRKNCGLLSSDMTMRQYCCSCFYQAERENSQQYSSYEKVLADKRKDQQIRTQQLKFLRKYGGCKNCGSLATDAYELYENSRLVCQSCLVKETGGSSSPISFAKQSQWYKKRWGIDPREWLDNYHCLPINANCAKKWLKNKQHLNNCACLEQETREIYQLFTNSLKGMKEKLAKCQCKTSEKFRVDSDYYAECEKCGANIRAASKKRVIKNRNDPKFWGLEIKEKVLCGDCLTNYQDQMPTRKKYLFNEYLKRGHWE